MWLGLWKSLFQFLVNLQESKQTLLGVYHVLGFVILSICHCFFFLFHFFSFTFLLVVVWKVLCEASVTFGQMIMEPVPLEWHLKLNIQPATKLSLAGQRSWGEARVRLGVPKFGDWLCNAWKRLIYRKKMKHLLKISFLWICCHVLKKIEKVAENKKKGMSRRERREEMVRKRER